MTASHSGYASLLGRPNVGKSTLLNRLLGQKISITAHKPQTTRHAILGIKTHDNAQIVYVDTPGLQSQAKRAMHRHMNRAADNTLDYVNCVVFVVEAMRFIAEDESALARIAGFPGPVLLAVNKVDRIADKNALLPFMESLAAKRDFAEIVPVSATHGDNLQVLESRIIDRLPAAELLFAEDQITTASVRFMAAELIREQLIRNLHQELPYALTVEIERFEERPSAVAVGAVIWVERPGQKAIVIGKSGATLKRIGQLARAEMETLLESKVHLETWVKVRSGWSDDERALQGLGFAE